MVSCRIGKNANVTARTISNIQTPTSVGKDDSFQTSALRQMIVRDIFTSYFEALAKMVCISCSARL
jgi:hypothetical protein